jgi:hypothetical protein
LVRRTSAWVLSGSPVERAALEAETPITVTGVPISPPNLAMSSHPSIGGAPTGWR